MNRDTMLHDIKEQLGDIDIAIEVGVWRGDYSKSMIAKLLPKTFYGIDPYTLYEGYTDKPSLTEFADQSNLDMLYNDVVNTFEGFNNNYGSTKSILVRELGAKYASQFADNSIDFVYLDADHKYEPVKEEIEAWFPKVKQGGILAGHDYTERSHIEEFGVIPAVDEFIQRTGLKLKTTLPEPYATWWVTKT
tara:strand:+ start:79 stop:651 length:573 start_codon:yes stop_codon:yes gene_type:complete